MIGRISAAALLTASVLAGCSSKPAEDAETKEATSFAGTYKFELGAVDAVDAGKDSLGDDAASADLVVKSECDEDECVASAVFVEPLAEMASNSFTLDYIDDKWVAVGIHPATCGEQQAEEFKVLQLTPGEDGQFNGSYTSLTDSDCNVQRMVRVTRVGDADESVTVPDPFAMPDRVRNRAAGFTGDYQFELTNQADQKQVSLDRKVATYCVRTGDRCVTVMTGQDRLLTWTFEEGQWNYTDNGPAKCADGRETTVADSSSLALPEEAPTPITDMVGIRTMVNAAPCPSTTDYSVNAKRTGD
ncbi:hypothetical protein CQY22_004285 [Mycolicibacterium brumae]|uniref:Uncharacterized protein n=2 Tax=Mycolicibacterium brumae TaxID=85968 RepID=A0A2G5PEX1_9MYCO|nr:hypothetical protein CQY22_004285 [Mycolicibacterium brumae]